VAVAVAVPVAVAVGVAVALGDAVGVPVAVGDAVAVVVAVGVAVVVAVAVAVAVAVGVGVGVPPPWQKISIDASGVIPSLAYPPESQMCVVPSVSVGKFRRAAINAGTGEPVVQQQMSTSFDGLGATRPPPITNISPLKLKARVSPVARGMACMPPMVLVRGSKLNELVVSTIVPP
jgi:hypothetical protein